jgi:hypothetical protein
MEVMMVKVMEFEVGSSAPTKADISDKWLFWESTT